MNLDDEEPEDVTLPPSVFVGPATAATWNAAADNEKARIRKRVVKLTGKYPNGPGREALEELLAWLDGKKHEG